MATNVMRSDMWDFYEDGVTQSMMTSFLKCPERFRLSVVEGLTRTSAGSSIALDYGSVFHKVLEDVYGGFGKDPNPAYYIANVPDIVDAAIQKSHDKAMEAYLERPQGMDAFEAMQLTHIAVGVQSKQYFNYYKEDWASFQWIDLEKVFDIPYKLKSGKVIRLRGKRDGAFMMMGHQLLENKTKGDVDSSFLLDTIGMDFQVNLYWKGMEEEFKVRPKGVLYNVVRRPRIKRLVKQSLDDFRDVLHRQMVNSPEEYFFRYPISLDPDEYGRWNEELASILDQMERWVNGEYHYRNTKSCDEKWGKCPFLRICSQGDMTMYRKREGIFMELNENETTSESTE